MACLNVLSLVTSVSLTGVTEMYMYGIVKDVLTCAGHEVLRQSSTGQQFICLPYVKLIPYTSTVFCVAAAMTPHWEECLPLPFQLAVVLVLHPSVHAGQSMESEYLEETKKSP